MPESETREPGALARLELDGLIRSEGDRYRTTRRWQGAMARAAYALKTASAGAAGAEAFDPRLPIVMALVDLYGADHPDAELTSFVEALLRIEAAELAPVHTGDAARPRV